MRVSELISCDIRAWAGILRRQAGGADIDVVAVDAFSVSPSVTRYRLTLARHSDPLTLIAKHTSAREAAFYSDLGPRLSFLTPHCWFSQVYKDEGWVVLDDVPNHRPASTWTETDVERVVGNLANLHTAFWNRSSELASKQWLEWRVLPVSAADGISLPKPHRFFPYRSSGLLSPHAFANAGPLAPAFVRAAAAVQVLEQLGGWPGVADQIHLEALKELLDDPVPMLHTLRTLPTTLVHGAPGPSHWHLTVFADCNLLDWSRVALGPGVLDLACLIEHGELAHCLRQGQSTNEAVKRRLERLVDDYLLQLYEALWPMVDTRAVRRALPAARCLFVLGEWLPRLAGWFEPLLSRAATSGTLVRMDDRQLLDAGQRDAVASRPYLAGLFARFWDDYKQL